MTKVLPNITFQSAKETPFNFEIISIDDIRERKEQFDHNPELPHQLKFYNFIFFTEGEGEHFVDFKWYPVKKNTLVYLTKEQVNAFKFSKDLKGFCILFTEKYFVEIFSYISQDFVFKLFNPQLGSPVLPIPETSNFVTYFNLLLKEYANGTHVNSQQILKSLFIILVSKAEQLKQDYSSTVINNPKITLFNAFLTAVENDYALSRSARYYATVLNMSYKSLNALSKLFVNKTAKVVIDDFIILQAKRNLVNSDLSAKELAYKLGFEDPTNFTKYFKKHTGLTPIRFLKITMK